MSASPVARQVVSQAIPVSRRVVISHENELPTDVSATPGGSIFSTTPGGTRIYYDRSALLALRNSPLSRTPPTNLPVIKGVTVPDDRPQEVIDAEALENYVDSDNEDAAARPSQSGAHRSQQSGDKSPPRDEGPDNDDSQFQIDL